MAEEKSKTEISFETLKQLRRDIETFCEEENISVNQLAARAGLDAKTVYNFVNGFDNPTWRTVTKLRETVDK